MFCPGHTYQTLGAQGEALLEAGAVKLERGTVTGQKPVAACELPSGLDLKRSSRQQVGGLTMRKGQ